MQNREKRNGFIIHSRCKQYVPFSRFDEEVSTVGIVTGGHFLSHFYLLAFPPLFPLLREEFATSNAQLGLLVGIVSAAMLLQILVGGFVDLVGAKRVFVGGIALTSLGVFLAGTASSYLGLLVFAALSGIGQSTFHPAGYPLLETVSDPDEIGRNFSIHTFGGFAGFTAAPLAVGTLGTVHGWRTALLVVGGIGLLYAVGAAVALRPVYRAHLNATEAQPEGESTSSRAAIFRPGILVMAAFFVFFALGGTGIRTFTPLLAVDGFRLTDATGNTALSAFFAMTAVSVLAGGILADWYDPRHVIAAATTTVTVTLLALVGDTVSVSWSTFVAPFALAGGAYGLVFASRDRLVSDYSAAESTGRSFGFVFTLSSLGGLVSPVLLGAVIDASTVLVAFVLIGVFFVISGAVVLAVDSERLPALSRVMSR